MTSTLTPFVQAPAAVRVRRPGRVVRAGLLAGLTAAAANFAVAATAHQLDVTFEVKGDAIPLIAFPQVTLMAAVIGIGLAAVFARWARRPRRTFVATTAILATLSMVPPAIVDAATATKLVLGLTHVIAAVIIIPAMASRLKG